MAAETIDPAAVEQVNGLAEGAKTASRQLALLSRTAKDEALLAIADALVAATDDIVTANAEDLDRGRENGLSEGLLDRLTLDGRRITAIAQAVRDIAGLPDPVGEVVRGSTLANGLQIRQVRVPMGVVGMIYEARPNVTADAAGICLKSGNAVLLRGSSSARSSNAAIVAALLYAYFTFSTVGIATRAGSEDVLAARLTGYSPDRLADTELRHRGLCWCCGDKIGGAGLVVHETTSAKPRRAAGGS